MTTKTARLIAVAKGDKPADLVLANARVVNVFTAEVETANVAICDGFIAGVGDYEDAKKVIDLDGKYLAPGFINGHTHIESSMLDIGQYANVVVPRGTSAVVTDLHELANVSGLEGIRYIMAKCRRLPFDVFMMAPSCVPATPFETSGANIGAEEIRKLMRFKNVIGLGEMMNFPGVINTDATVLEKIKTASGLAVDGHAPGLTGRNLAAYIAAGIHSDHESVTKQEGEEKLRRGMRLLIREGSSEKNLEALLPLVTDKTYKRCLFVVDDRSAADLLNDGDIDAVVRKAISLGLEPIRAIQLATINAAEYFKLEGLGGIAPGYMANMIATDNLKNLKIDMVFYRGKLVARQGKPLFKTAASRRQPGSTVNIKPFGLDDLKIPATDDEMPIIEVIPGQIVTGKITLKPNVAEGSILADTKRDILKLAVLERHHASGNIGLGLVKGFGLKKGALASSVAHDSHNIISIGIKDEDILAAVKEIEKLGGGLAVTSGGKVLGSLALPIGGLMSTEPLEIVVDKLEELKRLAKELGCPLDAPFATLSFMALPVIPRLRLTDKGLFDVDRFRFVNE